MTILRNSVIILIMQKILFFLIFVCSTLSYAAEEENLSSHPYYLLLQNSFTKAKEVSQSYSSLCKPVELLTGKSVDEIFTHYENLSKFIVSNLPKTGQFGEEGTGFTMMNNLLTAKDMELLKTLTPRAIDAYINANREMSWNDWQKLFNNDPILATKALCLQNGNVITRLKEPNRTTYRQLLINNDPAYKATSDYLPEYKIGSIKENAFGLDLTPGTDATKNLGRAYKTVPGLLWGITLFNEGYSANDAHYIINRATLMYETADLLYDHLDKRTKDASMWRDSPNSYLQKPFDTFLSSVREDLLDNPSKAQTLVADMIGINAAAPLVPEPQKIIDINNEFNLTLLLLNQYASNKDLFLKNYEKFLNLLGPKEKSAILNLLESGKKDIETITKGVDFVYEKTKETKPPKTQWEGIMGKVQTFSSVCNAMNIFDRLNFKPDCK